MEYVLWLIILVAEGKYLQYPIDSFQGRDDCNKVKELVLEAWAQEYPGDEHLSVECRGFSKT